MPVTVGVFVPPGVVKPTSPDALPRFNRSYEYDGLGDSYARFLLDEVLPAVEAKAAPDGRKIVLSKSGNDRAIGGSSSGAVCAFTAAWERPDAFRRVFSAIGTYVGLRGANVYPTLIRKVEPKPLRVYLEDGENDLNIYGGDWWMANQEMERSLKFAGYEVEHSWGKGGHSGAAGTKLFLDAMRWLWKGWPEAPKTGPRVQPATRDIGPRRRLATRRRRVQVHGGAGRQCEGRSLLQRRRRRRRPIRSARTASPSCSWKPPSAATARRSARTAGCTPTPPPACSPWDAAGKSTLAASGFKGNDLVVRHDGGIFVTAPFAKPNDSQIYYVSPKGESKVVDTGLKFANGICTSPDQSLLYVADSRTHWVYSYQIMKDGYLTNKQKYFHIHVPDAAEDSGVDGLRTDTAGRLWAATRMGLQVCDQAGRVNCIIPTPNGKVSNLTFGGEKFDALYVTCGDKVYSRKVKAVGSNAYMPPTTPKAPRL